MPYDKRLVVRLDEETRSALEARAAAAGVTLTALVVAFAEGAADHELPDELIQRARTIDAIRRRRSPTRP